MPDISMCPSQGCPSRSTCRRNEASGTLPNNWQWMMDFDRERAGRDRCTSYWPVGDATGTGKGEEVGDYVGR